MNFCDISKMATNLMFSMFKAVQLGHERLVIS